MTIGKKALQSTIFVTLATVVNFVVSFLGSVILARLLLPSHFGVLALSTFFLNLYGRIREFGFDQALIHRQKDVKSASSTHFTLQVGLSFLSFLLILISLPILSRFYDPAVSSVLLVLAFFVIFQAASSTPRVILEKELMFKVTTLVETTSLVLSTILAIFLAFLGFGVLSLVAGRTSQIFFNFLGLWWASKFKPAFSLDREMIKWFFKFGVFLWVGALTTFILFQYNDFIIGTMLGTEILGFYSRAFNFSLLPASLITAAFSKVALPTYAKLQRDKQKLERAFNLVLQNIARLSAPLSLILFLTAREFVLVLIGEKWLPMVPIFRLLIVYGFFRSIFDDVGAFLSAIGKPNLFARYVSLQALSILILSPIFVRLFGARGAALSLDLVMLFGLFLAYFYSLKFVKVYYFKIFGPIFASVFITIFIFSFLRFYDFSKLSVFESLVVKGAFAGIIYLLCILIFEGKKIKKDLLYFLKIVKGR